MNRDPGEQWFATDAAFWKRVPMPIIAWKLWYADGHTWCSSDCAWADAPREGVEVLMVYHAQGRRTIVAGRDEYTLPGETATKLGLMMDRVRFERMQLDAIADDWRP